MKNVGGGGGGVGGGGSGGACNRRLHGVNRCFRMDRHWPTVLCLWCLPSVNRGIRVGEI